MNALKQSEQHYDRGLMEIAQSLKVALKQRETTFGSDKTDEVIRVIKGTTGTPSRTGTTGRTSTRSRATTPSRRRTPTRRKTTGNGSSTVDGPQLMSALQEMGWANQSQLASRFGVSRATIAKRLDTLTSEGLIERHGVGSQIRWRPKQQLVH